MESAKNTTTYLESTWNIEKYNPKNRKVPSHILIMERNKRKHTHCNWHKNIAPGTSLRISSGGSAEAFTRSIWGQAKAKFWGMNLGFQRRTWRHDFLPRIETLKLTRELSFYMILVRMTMAIWGYPFSDTAIWSKTWKTPAQFHGVHCSFCYLDGNKYIKIPWSMIAQE